MNKDILNHYNESLRVYKLLFKDLSNVEEISKYLIKTIKRNNNIFVYGNGGSFSDSSHFVGELTATYKKKIENHFLFFYFVQILLLLVLGQMILIL